MNETIHLTFRLTPQAESVFKAVGVLLAWGYLSEREAERIIYGFSDTFELVGVV